MKKEEKEIPTLEQVQSIIAKKYGLGEKLVTGHAKKYFDEASVEFAKIIRKDIVDKLYEYSCDRCADAMNEIYPESNIK